MQGKSGAWRRASAPLSAWPPSSALPFALLSHWPPRAGSAFKHCIPPEEGQFCAQMQKTMQGYQQAWFCRASVARSSHQSSLASLPRKDALLIVSVFSVMCQRSGKAEDHQALKSFSLLPGSALFAQTPAVNTRGRSESDHLTLFTHCFLLIFF